MWYNNNMTKRKDRNLVKFGAIIKQYRIELSLRKETRDYFLDDRVRKGLIDYEDISVKTLTNIENGYNLPSLSTLKILATALETDFFQLLSDVYDYIPRH